MRAKFHKTRKSFLKLFRAFENIFIKLYTRTYLVHSFKDQVQHHFNYKKSFHVNRLQFIIIKANDFTLNKVPFDVFVRIFANISWLRLFFDAIRLLSTGHKSIYQYEKWHQPLTLIKYLFLFVQHGLNLAKLRYFFATKMYAWFVLYLLT